EDLVVAAQLDVFEARPLAQGVVGQVENVIRLVVGQMDLEQYQAAVDGVDQPEPARQGMDGADATVGSAAVAVADLIVDVGGGEHRACAALEVGLVEAALDPALALAQLSAYLSI